MQVGLRIVAGSCAIVLVAVVFGLTANAFHKDGLPLIRKPLSQTRKVVKSADLVAKTSTDVRSPSAAKKAAVSITEVDQPETKSSDTKIGETIKPKTVALVPKAKKSLKTPVEPKKIQALFTTLKDAKACFDKKSAIFLDARAIEDFDTEHISGASWLGYESLDENYGKVLGKTPKSQLIVTYCSDQQCASAINLADALVARGHTRVVIMLEGLPGWKDAGYPVVSEEEAKN
ncbi:MAG: rhodanese-like domain-containing protein [Armatimonadota bacterium]|nr:rhodanese-like domain-containing protein [bacterium]